VKWGVGGPDNRANEGRALRRDEREVGVAAVMTPGPTLGAMSSRRMNFALVFSLLVHGLLLSLSFGQGVGLPGLEFPWQKRRAEAPELRVVLAGAPPLATPTPAAEPLEAAAGEPAAPGAPAPAEPSQSDAEAATEVRMLSAPEPDAVVLAPPARALLAATRPTTADWAVPAASAVPTAAVAVMSSASSPAVEAVTRMRDGLKLRSEPATDLAQLDVRRPEAVVAAFSAASSPAVETLRRASDSLRLRAERPTELPDARALPSATLSTLAGSAGATVESLRRGTESLRPRADTDRSTELAQLDAARQQAQQGAQRLEAARLDALRQEAARVEAARLEALRQETARVEAARQEAARQDAARADVLRQETARLEAARQETARAAAAKLAAAQAEEEQREARKRAIGRQLDEEAAQRDAQRDAERQRPDWAPARRGRLFGRTDANAELVAYGESWSRKIEMNPAAFDLVRNAVKPPHLDAIVTVAVRSNGSVETVTFVRSSGVPAVDEAIRRVVQSQENYPAFPPALLRDYDVVEIRRTWHFDTAIRLN
jgi:TonB family protein